MLERRKTSGTMEQWNNERNCVVYLKLELNPTVTTSRKSRWTYPTLKSLGHLLRIFCPNLCSDVKAIDQSPCRTQPISRPHT